MVKENRSECHGVMGSLRVNEVAGVEGHDELDGG
jgi:hypothetical protein